MMGFIGSITYNLMAYLIFMKISTWAMVDNNQSDMPEKPLVELLISDYLKVEQNLWATIQSRGDNVLLQVFNTHERFLRRTLSDTNAGIAKKLLDSGNLAIQVVAINETVEMGYAHLRDKDLEREIITEFAATALQSLKNCDEFYDIVGSEDFWKDIKDELITKTSNSAIVESKHQVVYDYYREFQAILLKHYVTLQMSCMVLHYYDGRNGIHYDLSIKYRRQFEERTSRMRELAWTFIQGTNRQTWMAQPKDFTSEESYTQITNFLQGFIDNEVNLNADASCSSTCLDYRYSRHYHCSAGTLCAEVSHAPTCNGVVRDCEEIDDSEIDICQNETKDSHISYVRYSDGRMMGRNFGTACTIIKAASWRRWFTKCSNCICICDDEPSLRSDRYISLRDAVSNIAENKIVTGVQLTKQNRIIRWIINERVLMPFGETKRSDDDTFFSSWKSDQNEFRLTDSDVTENVDYIALNYERRAINLNYLTAPKGHAVTGVRFRSNRDGPISFEIRTTEFDFCTGRLKNLDKSMWITNAYPPGNKIVLQQADVPTRTKMDANAVVNRITDGYVLFDHTDFWKNVGQLTVPFIDTQKLEPERPAVLSGIGLHLRNSFLAPRLIVYNFQPYLEE